MPQKYNIKTKVHGQSTHKTQCLKTKSRSRKEIHENLSPRKLKEPIESGKNNKSEL